MFSARVAEIQDLRGVEDRGKDGLDDAPVDDGDRCPAPDVGDQEALPQGHLLRALGQRRLRKVRLQGAAQAH